MRPPMGDDPANYWKMRVCFLSHLFLSLIEQSTLPSIPIKIIFLYVVDSPQNQVLENPDGRKFRFERVFDPATKTKVCLKNSYVSDWYV